MKSIANLRKKRLFSLTHRYSIRNTHSFNGYGHERAAPGRGQQCSAVQCSAAYSFIWPSNKTQNEEPSVVVRTYENVTQWRAERKRATHKLH